MINAIEGSSYSLSNFYIYNRQTIDYRTHQNFIILIKILPFLFSAVLKSCLPDGVVWLGGCASLGCSLMNCRVSSTGTSSVLPRCWLYWSAHPSVWPLRGLQNSRTDSTLSRNQTPSSFWVCHKYSNIHLKQFNCSPKTTFSDKHSNIHFISSVNDIMSPSAITEAMLTVTWSHRRTFLVQQNSSRRKHLLHWNFRQFV